MSGLEIAEPLQIPSRARIRPEDGIKPGADGLATYVSNESTKPCI